ncbi:MAG: Uma2 family endonuclease, partial [Actinobacteria bacterium]|nr:Uma2 family endonuclease [Actinomycetota bacterium]
DKGFARGVPDLVVEVMSPSSGRYDRVVKLGWYATAGVREYWIVDPLARTLERLVLGEDGRYVIAQSLTDDAVFEPESFFGLSLRLEELWVEGTAE